MADIEHMSFSNQFSYMDTVLFKSKFHLDIFPRVHLIALVQVIVWQFKTGQATQKDS